MIKDPLGQGYPAPDWEGKEWWACLEATNMAIVELGRQVKELRYVIDALEAKVYSLSDGSPRPRMGLKE